MKINWYHIWWYDLKTKLMVFTQMKTIINFMGHNLTIIVVWNLFFIGLYEIDTNVIHLLVLFEHWCCVHYLDMNVICMFILFKHECCVFICIVYIQKLCTQLLYLNNAWHSCVNDTNPWNKCSCMDLEWTHEAYKFVMTKLLRSIYLFFNFFGEWGRFYEKRFDY